MIGGDYMPYCRNCGNHINEHDDRCFECGAPNTEKPRRRDNVVRCPSCESSSISFVSETRGSDYDVGSGCCGYILLGPFGLLCGLAGGDKKTITKRKCNSCGREF